MEEAATGDTVNVLLHRELIVEKHSEVVTPGNSMFKYADDTYVVIPACNALSRDAELDNVTK